MDEEKSTLIKVSTIQTLNYPSFSFSIVLDDQMCVIDVEQKCSGLYVSLMCDKVTVFSGVLADNLTPLPPFSSKDFKGKLFFVDTMGELPPEVEGLGERWQLYYCRET